MHHFDFVSISSENETFTLGLSYSKKRNFILLLSLLKFNTTSSHTLNVKGSHTTYLDQIS